MHIVRSCTNVDESSCLDSTLDSGLVRQLRDVLGETELSKQTTICWSLDKSGGQPQTASLLNPQLKRVFSGS
jgi:hypothetical protein